MLKQQKIPTNTSFAGIYNFDCTKISEFKNIFEKFLQYATDTHLVMCHPGLVDDELKRVDSVTTAREIEYKFLLDKN